MGFLTILGDVLTYDQYRDKIEKYKQHGLDQFISVYNAHKLKFIPLKELKWGEEMEYEIYVCDQATNTIKLSNCAT